MVNITQEDLRKWFDYNPDTGVLTWKSKPTVKGRVTIGSEAGTIKRGSHGEYRHTQILNYRTGSHRIIWCWMTGVWPDEIDHLDRNGLNNKWCNLEDKGSSRNMLNRSRSNRCIHLRGTTPRKNGKWAAQIGFKGKNVHIGTFESEQEAHDAYLKKSLELFGESFKD